MIEVVDLLDLLNALDDGSINQVLEFLDYDVFEAEKESKKYRICLILDNLGLRVIDVNYLIDLMELSLDLEKYNLFLDRLKEVLEDD